MADWDSADLLARCKRYAARPVADEQMADADWYALLTEAQGEWLPILATHAPAAMMGPLTALTPNGTNTEFDFPANTVVYGQAEFYDGTDGTLLRLGHYSDPSADLVLTAAGLVTPLGRSRTFGAGLYARWIPGPTAISAATQPTLLPAHIRILLVYRALQKWASIGQRADPGYWEAEESKAAWDDPRTGKIGLVTALKTQYRGQEDEHMGRRAPWWWGNPDLDNLRHRLS
jgi:hypothetical protein